MTQRRARNERKADAAKAVKAMPRRARTSLLLATATYARAFSRLTDRLFEIPHAKLIHAGDAALPPLIECSPGNEARLPLASIVKPPDAESLYEWMTMYGNPDGDPSWASVWPAAAALAAHLASNPELVEGKRAVELGCGLAIPSLVAAASGAASVTLMDREPLALHCALSTAECCGLSVGPVGGTEVVAASVCDWGEFAEQSAGLNGGVDLVLAAEVLYDPADAAPLASCVARILGASGRGGKLLLADPAQGRAVGCRERLLAALEASGATHINVESLARAELDKAAVQMDGPSKQDLVLLTAEWEA